MLIISYIGNIFDGSYTKIKDTIINGIDSKYLSQEFCGIGKSRLMYTLGLFNLLHCAIITKFLQKYVPKIISCTYQY